MLDTERVELGTFEVVSGKLVVSDPCYERDIWCAGTLENVRNGEWNASADYVNVEDWGRRVSKLIAQHMDCPDDNSLIRRGTLFEVGVDSGQAGIFDSQHYQDGSILLQHQPHATAEERKEAWYTYCCNLTLARLQAGVLPYGAVSSSGFGDGGYDCVQYVTNSGEVVKVEIEFITEDELDENEEV